MKKKLVALMLSSAVLCITAAPAVAGEREGAFSISPFVGGYTFDGVQHLETAPVFGLRLGYDLTKNWGVELVGDYLATDGTRSERSINALSYRLDFLYNFMPDGPLVPYLAAGGGGITAGHGSNFQAGGSNTSATANVGGGRQVLPDRLDCTARRCPSVVYFCKVLIALNTTGNTLLGSPSSLAAKQRLLQFLLLFSRHLLLLRQRAAWM